MATSSRARNRKRWIHAKGKPTAATGPLLLDVPARRFGGSRRLGYDAVGLGAFRFTTEGDGVVEGTGACRTVPRRLAGGHREITLSACIARSARAIR